MAGPKFLKLFLFLCITVQIANSQNSKRSLAIVFDVTGSMSDEINSLRDGVKLLLQSFTSRADNPISDYIFVQFRDEEREPTILPTIVETDANEIYKHLDAFGINPGSNGDCLESCFRGIKYGLEKSAENSIMFVFTDAGTKHKEMKPELEKLIQQKKVTVYFFLTEGCGRQDYEIQYYRDLAASSNGLVFDVDYRQITEHFPKYRDVISDKLEITGQIQGPAGTSKVPIDVDSSMKEFMFTIVAQEPLITIIDPNNNTINNYEILTNLTTIKMIKVINPEPGKWTVQVETTTPYSGQVSIISDLSFKYGFAVHEPNSITQTSSSPLAGQYNYLAILPSDSSLIRNLESVILATKNESHRFSLRKYTVAEGDLYITNAIELPNVAFKVILHGIDPVNHAIKRLLSPDISPLPADKPGSIIVPKLNVEEGDPIYLICRVDSMISTTVSWWKLGQNSALKVKTFMQSDILNHTIAEAHLSDAGQYNCVANNIAGETISTTMVNVNRTTLEKPTILSTKSNIEVNLDDILRLECNATGKPKPIIKWYKYEQDQQYDIANYPGFNANGEILLKRHAENSDTTKYMCIAQNKVGNVSHIFNVIILNDLHYFSSWSDWSTCTKTCGEGTQFRTRNCLRASCNQTRKREERQCTTIGCAVDGGWSDFSPYSECSKTCTIHLAYDVPTKQKRRECNNPIPAFGGKYCEGEKVRILNCTVPLCHSVGPGELKYPPCLDQPICCPIGFEYDNNTLGCKETDKCKRKGPYSVCRTDNQLCQNVGDDDYECVCRPGYKLRPSLSKKNPKYPKCMDIDECKQEPFPCGSGKCANSQGSFSCL